MKKTTTLEEMIFGRRDGPGMTVRILEKGAGWDPGATFHKFELETVTGSQSFPLGTPKMTRLMGEALIRTADRMDAQPHAGGRHSLFREEDVVGTVRMRAGLRMRPVYQQTVVQDQHGTGRRLLGIDWMDEFDCVVRFEALPSDTRQRGSGGSTGSEPQFMREEIGMSLDQVTAHRIAKGLPDPQFVSSKYHPEITTIQTRYVRAGVDPADLSEIGVRATDNDAHHLKPDFELVRTVADIAEAGDNILIRTAIGTFYALPFLRRNQEARLEFAKRLAVKLDTTLDEVRDLIRRVKAD